MTLQAPEKEEAAAQFSEKINKKTKKINEQ